MRIPAGVLAFAGLLAAVPAAAVDRLVDDHLTPCMSGPLPLHATIGEAVAVAAAGETILVCAGNYSEGVIVNQSNLTIRAQGLVKLVSPGGIGFGFLVGTAGGVTIQGFDISGYSACGIGIGGEAAGDFYIRDNHIHDNGVGICYAADALFVSPKIQNNVIEGNHSSGVRLFHASNEKLSANIIRNNGGTGISLNDCHGSTVDHNLVTGNHTGISVVECHPVIRNNTLRDNVSWGISISGAGGGVVTHNLVQSSAVGVSLMGADCELSFNSIAFNQVGVDVRLGGVCLITRNNVSRSSTIDCTWDGTGDHTFVDNSCRTELPPGDWD
jgi:parallel beta-helix repeat protein